MPPSPLAERARRGGRAGPIIRRGRPGLLILLALAPALAACRAAPAPPTTLAARPMSDPAPLKIGVGLAPFTPDKGYPLGGYGGGLRRESFPLLFGVGLFGRWSLDLRQSLAEDDPDSRAHYLAGNRGAHDPVSAKALAIIPEGQAPLVLCRMDLIIMTAALHDRVAELIAELGVPRERLILSATHSHSSVGAFHRGRFPRLIAMDNFRPEIFELLAQAAAESIRQAIASARPATLGVARAEDNPGGGSVARNRRSRRVDGVDRDDRDPEILALVARALPDKEEAEDKDQQPGPIIAVLVNFAVHPTVLGPQNLYFSADIGGAIERQLSAALPGAPPVLFFNGAEGDIAPARSGLKVRGGLMLAEAIAERFAGLAAPAIKACRGERSAAAAVALGERDFGGPFAYFCLGSREAFHRGERSWASWLTFPLTLPLNVPIWVLGAAEARVVLTWNLRFGLVADLGFYTDVTSFRYAAWRLKLGEDEIHFAGLPGEATHDLGLAIKEAGKKRGARHVFVLGLSDDAMGYITSEREYYRGGYEATSTLFGPETGPLLKEGLEAAFDAIGAEPKKALANGD